MPRFGRALIIVAVQMAVVSPFTAIGQQTSLALPSKMFAPYVDMSKLANSLASSVGFSNHDIHACLHCLRQRLRTGLGRHGSHLHRRQHRGRDSQG